MPRRIMLQTGNDNVEILEEILADNEKQLQELVKDNPDLLPVEDLGMTGPLAVIGRETGLPSGSVDLVALSREGNLLVVEFKTGPNNPDFRAALAQLVDYGSDLWGRDWESFERDVPLRYFKSNHCPNRDLARCDTLLEALAYSWDGLDDGDRNRLKDRLTDQLNDGRFHYVLLAQRFTDTILKTIEYLNEVSTPRFYAIEVVRFGEGSVEAFEARLIKGPSVRRPGTAGRRPPNLTELEFLDQFPEGAYGDAVRELVDHAKKCGYTVSLGSSGCSFRRRIPESAVAVTVAWIAPPGKRAGPAADVTLGSWSKPSGVPSHTTKALETVFRDHAAKLGDLEEIARDAYGVHLAPETFMARQQEVFNVLHLIAGEIDTLCRYSGSLGQGYSRTLGHPERR